MALKVFKLVFLVVAVMAQFGCASVEDTAADPANDVVPVSSHDDSHGWGTTVKGM